MYLYSTFVFPFRCSCTNQLLQKFPTFPEDGILETALLGYEERAYWKWDTALKVIVVKYNDNKTREWGISFNSELIKTWNDFEKFELKNETTLDNVAPASRNER